MVDLTDVRPWYLFEVSSKNLVNFLERKSGREYVTGQSQAAMPEVNSPGELILHINLGIPGFEEPDDPIEENPCALDYALNTGMEKMDVILSGEWSLAVSEGLISPHQLAFHERAFHKEHYPCGNGSIPSQELF